MWFPFPSCFVVWNWKAKKLTTEAKVALYSWDVIGHTHKCWCWNNVKMKEHLTLRFAAAGRGRVHHVLHSTRGGPYRHCAVHEGAPLLWGVCSSEAEAIYQSAWSRPINVRCFTVKCPHRWAERFYVCNVGQTNLNICLVPWQNIVRDLVREGQSWGGVLL